MEKLFLYLRRNNECALSRKKIMDECYRGGDKRHEIALRQVHNAIMNCSELIGRLLYP